MLWSRAIQSARVESVDKTEERMYPAASRARASDCNSMSVNVCLLARRNFPGVPLTPTYSLCFNVLNPKAQTALKLQRR